MGDTSNLNNNAKSFKKGDLVRLNPVKCFTIEFGGELEYPLTNYANDHAGVVEGFYVLTEDERDRLSYKYAGLDSAGEPKIVPTERYAPLHRDRFYTVVKARTTAFKNFRKIGGLALVLDTHSGENVYVSRELLERV